MPSPLMPMPWTPTLASPPCRYPFCCPPTPCQHASPTPSTQSHLSLEHPISKEPVASPSRLTLLLRFPSCAHNDLVALLLLLAPPLADPVGMISMDVTLQPPVLPHRIPRAPRYAPPPAYAGAFVLTRPPCLASLVFLKSHARVRPECPCHAATGIHGNILAHFVQLQSLFPLHTPVC